MPSPKPKAPPAFPAVGDRVRHHQYGVGSTTMLDVYHTVIDFDAYGPRRFVTDRVVVERTDDPGPTPSERRAILARRAKEERARVKAAALVEKVPTRTRRRTTLSGRGDEPPVETTPPKVQAPG